jgi:TonB family protein
MVALAALLLALGLIQGQAPAVALSDLDAVKSLYASASYEEALTRLDQVDPADESAQLDQYRALSQLALGRTADAEQTFDRLVHRDPQYVLSESDVSPRVAAMFHEVRQRVLPSVAREMYAKGKSSFDQRRYDDASAQLKALLSVLSDADLAAQAAVVDDLKQLAQGFLRLSEIEIEAAARAAAAPPPPPAPVEPVAPAPDPNALTVTKIVIYTADDAGVIPPVEVERRMPPWTPPAIMARSAQYRGALEIVVNEVGSVESATMIQPTVPGYDVVLLDAAHRWRFQPARRNGQTVKYRLRYSVVLSPRQ